MVRAGDVKRDDDVVRVGDNVVGATSKNIVALAKNFFLINKRKSKN